MSGEGVEIITVDKKRRPTEEDGDYKMSRRCENRLEDYCR